VKLLARWVGLAAAARSSALNAQCDVTLWDTFFVGNTMLPTSSEGMWLSTCSPGLIWSSTVANNWKVVGTAKVYASR
jgi:hypothetical protein